MPHVDLLIKNAMLCTMNDAGTVLPNADIGITGNTISHIVNTGGAITLTGDTTINAAGKVVFPGFINTHTHIFQSFLKGLGSDHQLIDWLNLSALPYGTVMTPDDHEVAAQLTCMEAIKSGCTTLCEFFYTTQDPQLAYSCIAGMESTGIRSVFIRTFQDSGGDYGMPGVFIEEAAEAMKQVEKLRTDFENRADMVTIWTGPDVTWSTTKHGYQVMKNYCDKIGMRYAMHIDETDVDNSMTQKNYGEDVVALLDKIGFLSPSMLGVHCVKLTQEEIDTFSKAGVSVSYNPVSNMYLGSGVAPIRECLDAGISVSIGTDGAASNNSTDFIEAMKFAALIQKGMHRDAARITAYETVWMATRGGAEAIGMADKLGSIEVGKLADLVIFNPVSLKSIPMHDPFSSLVYSSSPENIHATIVNGKTVYSEGDFASGLTEATIQSYVDIALERLAHKLSL